MPESPSILNQRKIAIEIKKKKRRSGSLDFRQPINRLFPPPPSNPQDHLFFDSVVKAMSCVVFAKNWKEVTY